LFTLAYPSFVFLCYLSFFFFAMITYSMETNVVVVSETPLEVEESSFK